MAKLVFVFRSDTKWKMEPKAGGNQIFREERMNDWFNTFVCCFPHGFTQPDTNWKKDEETEQNKKEAGNLFLNHRASVEETSVSEALMEVKEMQQHGGKLDVRCDLSHSSAAEPARRRPPCCSCSCSPALLTRASGCSASALITQNRRVWLTIPEGAWSVPLLQETGSRSWACLVQDDAWASLQTETMFRYRAYSHKQDQVKSIQGASHLKNII